MSLRLLLASVGAVIIAILGTHGVVLAADPIELRPSDVQDVFDFGRSLALYGDTLVVGASRDDQNGPDTGSSFVFVKSGSTWVEQAKLVPADPIGGTSGSTFLY